MGGGGSFYDLKVKLGIVIYENTKRKKFLTVILTDVPLVPFTVLEGV